MASGERRVAQRLVPVAHGDLTGDDRRAQRVAVLDHLQEVGALDRGERAQGEVVEHEDIELGPRRQEPRQPSVGARQGQLVEEAWDAQVQRAVDPAQGGLGERAGQVRLARAGRPHDEHGAVRGHPLRVGEREDERAVEAAGTVEVEVLERR